MENSLEHISDILHNIKGNGTFVVSGAEKIILPGLRVKNLGEISFPIDPVKAKSLIQVSHKAPFGKGSKTIYDNNVRSAWEIDATSISFHNPEWSPYLKKIIKKVKKGLGFEKEKSIEANLYKLLIYETGDFFLPHKDSEKEKGMFGTLIIGLPSDYTGGLLNINFDGRNNSIDFSEAFQSYKIPYAAFFADCEHEVKPILSGYRICLVYNLINKDQSTTIRTPKFSSQQIKISKLLISSEKQFNKLPKVILLGHEYTPTNFSLQNLKGHDRPRAEALLNATRQTDYYASLALLTHYQNGQLESDYYYEGRYSYRNRGYREEPDYDGTMGEVYDEYSYVEHWSSTYPGLGDLHLEQKDIITEFNLGDGEPTEKEEEGYTGNAGMSIEYWYHYGAIVLWPKSSHISILNNRPLENRLEWIDYYMKESKTPDSEYTDIIKEILLSFVDYDFENFNRGLDVKTLTRALCFVNDPTLIQNLNNVLNALFDTIGAENWMALIEKYQLSIFKNIFISAGNSSNLYKIGVLLSVLKKLALEETEEDLELLELIDNIPNYISTNNIHVVKDSYLYYGDRSVGRTEVALFLILDLVVLSNFKDEDKNWVLNVQEQITKSLSRKYLNKVLVPALLESKNRSSLFYKLLDRCKQELLNNTKEKPQPPENWIRKVPKTENHTKVWEMLTPFLNSPIDFVYEYRANQQLREGVENALGSVTIDLKTETIKKGSPYTLKITKTQQEYKRLLKQWNKDKSLLHQLEKFA
ncbi:hypothetical protein NBT05_07860 [Aquimarina sp. ERC-38]|uniref:hypothetical protein n=1 Tax=Aquimarina sp. ERC-38 TaxID=2949996 RepID=UPI0022459EEE|nr:hypothetical protein [Aquimarina sp. ERC-38]UZO82378.1 hypothetical protein NBT05_07860 [Aquimarina sp. ERC-38]